MAGKIMVIEGTISAGLGEGAFFISMQRYKNEIHKKLGFEPYPGTLNLKVDSYKPLLSSLSSIRIDGFTSGKKKFGGAACCKAKIKNIEGAIIFPDITKHKKGIIELIAPVHLKSQLKLKNGDRIKIELKG